MPEHSTESCSKCTGPKERRRSHCPGSTCRRSRFANYCDTNRSSCAVARKQRRVDTGHAYGEQCETTPTRNGDFRRKFKYSKTIVELQHAGHLEAHSRRPSILKFHREQPGGVSGFTAAFAPPGPRVKPVPSFRTWAEFLGDQVYRRVPDMLPEREIGT